MDIDPVMVPAAEAPSDLSAGTLSLLNVAERLLQTAALT